MGRYFWLKLKRDFFKRADVMLVESMPNGKDYILFYLKLMVESIDHEGRLRFNEAIPYNENMLATITNTNIDIVRSAVKVLTQMGLMDILDDGTYFMSKVVGMIGSETEYAAKKRFYREQLKDNPETTGGQIEDMSRTMSETMSETMSRQCPTEIDKEIDIDIYNNSLSKAESAAKKTDGNVENVDNVENSESAPPIRFPFGSNKNVMLTLEECRKLQEEFPQDYTNKIETLSCYLKLHPEKTYSRPYEAIKLWAARDAERAHRQQATEVTGMARFAAEEKNRKNSFHRFEQQEYDFDAIDRKLDMA